MIEKEIIQFGVKAQRKTLSAIVKSIHGLSTDIIYDTPADTGRLKNNWLPSLNSPNLTENDGLDPSGNKAIASVKATTLSMKLGDTFYLTNNLPYARVVEFGEYPNPPKKGTGKTINGFSTKSPAGMCRKNILKWSKYFV